ncbi:hypothetical protein [Bradyrhizobium cenepequi]
MVQMDLEMMAVIQNWFAFQFAGIWPMVGTFGLGGTLLLICAAGWYFIPNHKLDFIWAAVVIIVVMVSTSIGVSLGEKRIQAQWDAARNAAFEKGKAARAGAVRDVARKPSRWLPSHPDRYDCDRHADPMCRVAGNPLPLKN